ncbi:DUF559 domain-containing protein [Hoyosella sp. G463]|uniref:DUF559 domain-containing protein n=1 Tax=Lolliginicoccus lacisalsi TaxID=2742202 RepID=A0A927PLY8_9ACTN|nr:DUF559 domain-containing protein [Lolliginicoccus lacisalsi]MBD8505851.1 DUF559 domain-containing protein [Lolliginicoccus lacisalsi]
MHRPRITRLLADQDGVITRAQARAAGLTGRQVDLRAQREEWSRVAPGIYLAADRPRTARADLRIALHHAGAGAIAHGPSAAWWHGMLDNPPRRHHATIPRHRRTRVPGCRIRHRDLDERDVTHRDGLPLTARALTVLETAISIPGGTVFLDRALQRHVSLPQLHAAHRRNRYRAGATQAGRMLRIAREGGASEAERLLQRLLRRGGFTGWRAHVRALGYELDVAFERERVAIEVDGWAWHRDAERFARDMDRQNALVNAGWQVLRFSWHHLATAPDQVVRDIRAALAARR